MRRKILKISLVIILIIICLYRFINWQSFNGITDNKVLPLLKHLPSKTERGNIPAKDGRLLYDLIIQHGYRHGLEIGTSNGYSTLWQGLSFRKNNGNVITIEIDTLIALEAKSNFLKAGLNEIIDLRINDAYIEIPAFSDSLDFVFIDTGPGNMDFFNLAYPLVIKGGTIVVHNVDKNDKKLGSILNNPDIGSSFKSRFFYKILICSKKKN